MPEDRSTITVIALAGLLVLTSVLMIAFGLPEQTLLQHRLLQLYSIPISGALALGVIHVATRLPTIDRATRIVLAGAGVASALGVGMMAAGLMLGLDALFPLAQALMWLSLGFALLWLVAHLPRSEGDRRTFGLRPIDAEEE